RLRRARRPGPAVARGPGGSHPARRGGGRRRRRRRRGRRGDRRPDRGRATEGAGPRPRSARAPGMTQTATADPADDARTGEPADRLALIIAWSAEQPERVGEIALFEEGSAYRLGRGPSQEAGRVAFLRQRPGSCTPTAPLEGAGISRDQLRVRARREALLVER